MKGKKVVSGILIVLCLVTVRAWEDLNKLSKSWEYEDFDEIEDFDDSKFNDEEENVDFDQNFQDRKRVANDLKVKLSSSRKEHSNKMKEANKKLKELRESIENSRTKFAEKLVDVHQSLKEDVKAAAKEFRRNRLQIENGLNI